MKWSVLSIVSQYAHPVKAQCWSRPDNRLQKSQDCLIQTMSAVHTEQYLQVKVSASDWQWSDFSICKICTLATWLFVKFSDLNQRKETNYKVRQRNLHKFLTLWLAYNLPCHNRDMQHHPQPFTHAHTTTGDCGPELQREGSFNMIHALVTSIAYFLLLLCGMAKPSTVTLSVATLSDALLSGVMGHESCPKVCNHG